jgi:hypothetical protein
MFRIIDKKKKQIMISYVFVLLSRGISGSCVVLAGVELTSDYFKAL